MTTASTSQLMVLRLLPSVATAAPPCTGQSDEHLQPRPPGAPQEVTPAIGLYDCLEKNSEFLDLYLFCLCVRTEKK